MNHPRLSLQRSRQPVCRRVHWLTATNFFLLRYRGGHLIDPAMNIKLPVPESRRAALARYEGVEIILGARPEHIRVAPRGQTRPLEAIDFTIDVAQHLGHEVLLDIVADPHRAVTRVAPDDFPKEGEQRPFEFDMAMVYFWDSQTGANIARRTNQLLAGASAGPWDQWILGFRNLRPTPTRGPA